MLLIFLVIWLTFSHVRKIEEYAWHGAKHVPETRYKIIFEPLCSGGRGTFATCWKSSLVVTTLASTFFRERVEQVANHIHPASPVSL